MAPKNRGAAAEPSAGGNLPNWQPIENLAALAAYLEASGMTQRQEGASLKQAASEVYPKWLDIFQNKLGNEHQFKDAYYTGARKSIPYTLDHSKVERAPE